MSEVLAYSKIKWALVSLTVNNDVLAQQNHAYKVLIAERFQCSINAHRRISGDS